MVPCKYKYTIDNVYFRMFLDNFLVLLFVCGILCYVAGLSIQWTFMIFCIIGIMFVAML